MLSLRPYQRQADAAIAAEFERHRSTLLVMATGCGKTVSFCHRIAEHRRCGRRVLVLAHRDELIEQPLRKLGAMGISASVEKGKLRAPLAASVVIASVQSLRGERLKRFPVDHFDEIVIDEAHHAVAPGYRDIVEHFAYAKVLGVTATPVRADGAALGDVFETVAFRYEIRDAIAAGYLVPIVARRIVLDGVDLSAVKTRAGDLAQDQLAAAMETAAAIDGVVVPLLEMAGDRPTVVFAVDVRHAYMLADALNARAPLSARAVSGQTDLESRRGTLADFAAGAFQFLVNCALLTEGWDAPHTSCVAIVRPTKSWALYVQMVGRGTRLSPGKPDLLLLDFTGQAGRHRLVGPADCLAGSDSALDALADDVLAEINRQLGRAEHNVGELIGEATKLVEADRAWVAADALVEFHSVEVDPYIGDDPSAVHAQSVIDPAWLDVPATVAQLKVLEAKGVPVKRLPITFSKAAAAALIGRLAARRSRGMCSLKQARLIAKYGIDTKVMTFDRARELSIRLRAASWSERGLYGTPEWRAKQARESQASGPSEMNAAQGRSAAISRKFHLGWKGVGGA